MKKARFTEEQMVAIPARGRQDPGRRCREEAQNQRAGDLQLASSFRHRARELAANAIAFMVEHRPSSGGPEADEGSARPKPRRRSPAGLRRPRSPTPCCSRATCPATSRAGRTPRKRPSTCRVLRGTSSRPTSSSSSASKARSSTSTCSRAQPPGPPTAPAISRRRRATIRAS